MLYMIGIVVVDLQLHMQSVPITTKLVSSNPTHGEVCSIQLYVIKIVSDLRQVGSFPRIIRFHPPIKLEFRVSFIGGGNWNTQLNPPT